MNVKGLTKDTLIWLGYHSRMIGADAIELDAVCDKLKDGKCSIYPNRPEQCKSKQWYVGSPGCLYAAKRLLSQAKFDRIVKLMPNVLQQTGGSSG
jgi:Fe-S-cluster containining protein